MTPAARLRLLELLVRIEDAPGDHTLTECPCGRMMCRGARCKLCVKEEMREIEASMKTNGE